MNYNKHFWTGLDCNFFKMIYRYRIIYHNKKYVNFRSYYIQREIKILKIFSY